MPYQLAAILNKLTHLTLLAERPGALQYVVLQIEATAVVTVSRFTAPNLFSCRPCGLCSVSFLRRLPHNDTLVTCTNLSATRDTKAGKNS